MGEPPDIGEAVEYILGERPRLSEDDVWAVLVELGEIPAPEADALAVDLVVRTRPGLRPRDVRVILKEWRAYASLAEEDDWED